jgi:GGDEF domain-containing protein
VFVGAISPDTLSLRMAVAERTLRHARTRQRLRFLARHPRLHDPMTGTLRPGVLEVQLDQALARVGRTQQSVALLAIEAAALGVSSRVDLSPLVVSRVAGALRSGDGVAIDEQRTVMAVLEGCSPAEAERIAEEVVRRLTASPKGGAGITFSCAVGVATQTPGEPGRDATTVMDAAGSALARAWMGGGDRVEVAGMGAGALDPAEHAA